MIMEVIAIATQAARVFENKNANRKKEIAIISTSLWVLFVEFAHIGATANKPIPVQRDT
jgi:hypothetical protein